uniref:hypothetical protein n=1 Tax=Serratia proteamaculans TaxID=28151 RepID=UPI001F4BD376|nr:hypothetical protein [Serratia proteamaculans]ULG16475.1 hypothetical protein 1137p_00077 [Serratia proteamaculans]
MYSQRKFKTTEKIFYTTPVNNFMDTYYGNVNGAVFFKGWVNMSDSDFGYGGSRLIYQASSAHEKSVWCP